MEQPKKGKREMPAFIKAVIEGGKSEEKPIPAPSPEVRSDGLVGGKAIQAESQLASDNTENDLPPRYLDDWAEK